jgi:hypothetical protein
MDLFDKPLRHRRYTRDVSETMDLTIVYEDGDDGWIVASIPAVPGVLSQAAPARKLGRTSLTL